MEPEKRYWDMRILFIIFLFVIAAPACAQTVKPTRYNYFDYNRYWYADPQYKGLAQSARRMAPDFSFGSLRKYYMQSSYYKPMVDDDSERLAQAAERLKKSTQGDETYKALQEANAILREQLGNLDIVSLAETLSKEDKRLGDPKFYAWLREGLIRNVLNSGDGLTPEGAYDVMTISEETMLLRELNMHVLDMQTVQDGTFYFNIYNVTDRKTGNKRLLFVNATYPLAKEAKNAESAERPLGLFRQ